MKKYIKNFSALLVLLALSMTACKIDEPVNPNQPSLEEINNDNMSEAAKISQLNNLVIGSLANTRTQLDTYIDAVGVIGREFYRFSGSDPRFTADLLGAKGTKLDNNAFYTTNPYAARYSTVKNLNILIDGVNFTQLISNEAKQGYLGFAKTLKAYELLMVLNQQYKNGIRVDVADPQKLGPFLGYEQSLGAIASLLNEGSEHLDKPGTVFTFPLSKGFDGFNTPLTFKKFNRALAARVALYRGNHPEALTYLQSSFMDLAGDLNMGVYHVYSPSSGDQLNQLFISPNATGDIRIVHPSWIANAEPNDARLAKVVKRKEEATSSGLKGQYDVYVYKSNIDRVPIIRNEELILIYAEANIQTDNVPEALKALNIIRTKANLAPYTGLMDKQSLINEMLKQRRYSLFFEGHRWIDLRRYNKLNELPIDREGDIVHEQFPRPVTEG